MDEEFSYRAAELQCDLIRLAKSESLKDKLDKLTYDEVVELLVIIREYDERVD